MVHSAGSEQFYETYPHNSNVQGTFVQKDFLVMLSDSLIESHLVMYTSRAGTWHVNS